MNTQLRDIAGFAPATFAWILGGVLITIQTLAFSLTIGALP